MPTSMKELVGCMDVWGGNRAVDSGVMMAGLDAWVYSKPSGGADSGGDVYYVSSCATGRITRLFVADVSGHGAAVSESSDKLRRLMRRHVNYLDQSRFIEALNREFATPSDPGRFATAIVATFFAPTDDLSLCNAGHPPPLLYRAATKQWEFLRNQPKPDGKVGNVPLGIIEQAHYNQIALRLHVGDMVLCYTDSLIEARDADGRLVGEQGLLDLISEIDVAEPQRVIPSLLEAIVAKAHADLTEDDVTVLLFRPNGMMPRLPLGEKVRAPLRLVRALLGSMRPGGEPMGWPELSLPNIGGAMFHRFNRLWRGRRKA